MFFRNGHLMTHRDKKPYQCTVPGCTKSYCDARSLRRHLENHHQHTVEQIAVEMVKAQSMAAEVLADVAASTGMVPQSSATNQRSSTDPNSAKSETVTGVKTSSNTPVTVTNMLVTKTQYVPVSMVSSAVVTSNTVTSTQPQTQAQQSHIFPYDIMVQQQQKMQKEQQQQVKKQQQQQIKLEKQQLKQQQQQKEIQQQEQRLKQEKEQQELKVPFFINEPHHDKTNKITVHPAKTQLSLGILPVWSESSLCAQWVAKDSSFLHADSEDSSDWVDAQADLSLRRGHMPFSWLCHKAAHIFLFFWDADREDTDHPGHPWSARLIWVFAGLTGHFVGFVMLRLNSWCHIFCVNKTSWYSGHMYWISVCTVYTVCFGTPLIFAKIIMFQCCKFWDIPKI